MVHSHFITLVFPHKVNTLKTETVYQQTLDIISQKDGTDTEIVRLSDTAFDILFSYQGGCFDLSPLRPFVDCGMGCINTRKKHIFISDMDSTIIAHETLDDVAHNEGLGNKVSEITKQAMAGKLGFEDSLRERVKLLAGKSYNAFDIVHKNLRINKGAHTTLATLKKYGVKTALVSGGFDITVNIVAKKLGFDHGYGNTLEVVDENISGTILGKIIGAETKKDILLELCKTYNTTPEYTIAIGDGANDLQMIETAHMGIGYMGKPIVRTQSDFQINLTDFTSVLYFMGIKRQDFCNNG